MAQKHIYIQSTTLVYLDSASAQQVHSRATARDPGLLALDTRCRADGFVPILGKDAAWGTKATWKQSDGVVLAFEFSLQSYRSATSKDTSAVFVGRLNATGAEPITYRGYLVAPKGNLLKAREFFANAANRVVPANSWWSAVVNCLKSRCVPFCAATLIACGAIAPAAYFGCVAVACGGCFTSCLACATCNCGKFCKKFVGCCRK